MKKTIISMLLCTTFSLFSQVTYNPTSYSNCPALSIEKITISDYKTIVEMKFYTTQSDYSFFINNYTYIQEYGNTSGAKYYIQRFVNNELGKTYTNDPYKTYYFTWEFDKLPSGLTNISIIEPEVAGYNSWYWKNITINNPLESANLMAQFDDYTYDKAKYLAKEFAEKLVDEEFDGGTNIYTSISNYDYNSYSNELEFDVSISFNGNIFTSNYYEVRGHLTISSDGTSKFTKQYANEQAQSYLSRKNWMIGGAALIFVLGSEGNK